MAGEEPKRFYGIYRGTVTSTADPMKKGRLMVRVPAVNGDGELGWALPCFPYLTPQPALEATAGTTTVTGKTKKITLRLPTRGAPVWVMFENGSPTTPVWMGTWVGL